MVGVTVIVAIIGPLVRLVATKEGISFDPLDESPMLSLSLVQLNIVPGSFVRKEIICVICEWQNTRSSIGST